MNYLNEGILFKIKKVFRYVSLYGLSRTLIKVKGQYHLNRKYSYFSNNHKPNNELSDIAIVGCGNFAFTTIAYYIYKYNRKRLRTAMDIDINRAYSLYKEYDLYNYTDSFQDILDDNNVKLVFISSNHFSHAEYAIECIRKGKSVHIEKPHVVNFDQLNRLHYALKMNPSVRVYLGFNRPKSQLFNRLKNHLDLQSGPVMINWFIAGHEIPDDHWYFDDKEGGRILGNLCHWTDLSFHLVGISNIFPCTIVPCTPKDSKSDFIISVIFSDKSCVSITFSAKGHTFEGVKEVLNIHKGNLLGTLENFKHLKLEIIDKVLNYRNFYRNHGHKNNVLNSLNSSKGETLDYVYASALLFLKIKEAVDTNSIIFVENHF